MPVSAASPPSSRPRNAAGMGDRVLSWQGGERQMTDLAHMTQLLVEAAHREHFSLPALRDWLREQREERSAQWNARAGSTTMWPRCRS